MKGRERQQLNIRMHEKKYEEENFFSVSEHKKSSKIAQKITT